MYKYDRRIFPGRKLLARLMGRKNENSISSTTRSLQDKGYLEKAYDKHSRKVYYLPYYNTDVDDSLRLEDVEEELVLSKRNRINKPPNDSENE